MKRLTLFLLSLLIGYGAQAATVRYSATLNDGDRPANGRFDLQLKGFDQYVGGQSQGMPVVFWNVDVRDGQVELSHDWELPAAVENDLWLELAVRDAGSGQGFTTVDGRSKASLAIGQCWSTTGDSGSNPNVNFLGTTDGAPLVLRSSSGIAVNTSSARDLLTLRGPDSYLFGPTLQMLGDNSDQSESGRIRFVEGTASGNVRGAYIRYDGAQNLLAIGAHPTSDTDPLADVDQITVARSATTRVGIGKVAGEELDVAGDIRLDGALKYVNSLRELRIAPASFAESKDNNCDISAFSIAQSSNFGAGTCTAHMGVLLPFGAHIHRIGMAYINNASAGSAECKLELLRTRFSTIADLALDVESGSATGFAQRNSTSGDFDTDFDGVFTLRARAFGSRCEIKAVLLQYSLPDGFLP